MHKAIRVECSCGSSVTLSKIQFDDFDCGMMGFLYCPKCEVILFPSSHRKDNGIKEFVFEVEGEDTGWL